MALHLTPALEQRLEHLAAHTHRSPDELAQEGVEALLDHEERSATLIARGQADIAAGRVVSHEEVVARFTRSTKEQ